MDAETPPCRCLTCLTLDDDDNNDGRIIEWEGKMASGTPGPYPFPERSTSTRVRLACAQLMEIDAVATNDASSSAAALAPEFHAIYY